MPRALLSVSDKTGLVDFAVALRPAVSIWCPSGGTARTLQQAGLPVVAISDVTGFPEMMDGRVKTLHPLVHGGILARRARPTTSHRRRSTASRLIDVVVVNLYPFVKTAAKLDTRSIRSSRRLYRRAESRAGGGQELPGRPRRRVPGRLPIVLEQLDRDGGPALEFRFDLARKAFAHTGQYDTAIAGTLAEIEVLPAEAGSHDSAAEAGSHDPGNHDPGNVASGFSRKAAALPPRLNLNLRKVRDLRYGENPHQQAALYTGFGSHPGFSVLQGKELSYTNLLDLDAAARIVAEFSEPAAVVIKHTNPCGAATGSSAADAYVRAREADALAAFGGIVGLNRAIDGNTAKAIVSTFIEAVIAPSVDDERERCSRRRQICASLFRPVRWPTLRSAPTEAIWMFDPSLAACWYRPATLFARRMQNGRRELS
jgi:phosphoribosylaminoimidazolecarboxamide formyltransferase/IMP cyclohydrolase